MIFARRYIQTLFHSILKQILIILQIRKIQTLQENRVRHETFNMNLLISGMETSYGNYNITYKQDFTTTSQRSIEEDVCHAWFSEDMAWMEIFKQKRSYPESARNGRDLSFTGVRVDGGSMISQVTFVSHWKLSTHYQKKLTISFQAESSKLIIKKDVFSFDNEGNSFALEVTFESLYDTVIVQKTDERVFKIQSKNI